MITRILQAAAPLLLPMWMIVAASPAPAQEEPEGSPLKLGLNPALEYRTVDGDEDKFREDWWMREGWAGGRNDPPGPATGGGGL